MARLLIPEPKNSARTDLLWEHTCFEAFIGLSGSPAYREFNFSPSGQWAAYAFDYRQRVEQPETEAPQIDACSPSRLELDAIVPAQALPDNTGEQVGILSDGGGRSRRHRRRGPQLLG